MKEKKDKMIFWEWSLLIMTILLAIYGTVLAITNAYDYFTGDEIVFTTEQTIEEKVRALEIRTGLREVGMNCYQGFCVPLLNLQEENTILKDKITALEEYLDVEYSTEWKPEETIKEYKEISLTDDCAKIIFVDYHVDGSPAHTGCL